MSVRKTFVAMLHEEMRVNKDIVLIAGDLGYKHFDDLRDEFPDRFFNPGAAEQLMIAMGVGMALEGKIAVCYSMTPFLLYRPFEIIRNYLERDQIPVKLIGAGRDKDYDWLGWSHWAVDDRDHMSGFKNIVKLWPENAEETKKIFKDVLYNNKPYYVNLSR